MPLEYKKIADLLAGLELSRALFASLHHVDEDPDKHVRYLRKLVTAFYEPGRNEQTAIRLVLVAALVADHGFTKDEACARAREAMPVDRQKSVERIRAPR
jgi:hypothetical protein